MDTAIYLETLPRAGSFAQAHSVEKRAGGTAANVAIAIASTGLATNFVGYVGDDDDSSRLQDSLKLHGLSTDYLKKLEGQPSSVLVIIEESGERTIIGIAPDRLDSITLEGLPLQEGDLVVFVLWREHFLGDLEYAKARGCTTYVGIEALGDSRVKADLAIGSHDFEADYRQHLDRFAEIVVTQGSNGVTHYSADGEISLPALPAKVVDATGAGDSFLAGFITSRVAGNSSISHSLDLGRRWAAASIATTGSQPVKYSEIPNLEALAP